MELEKRFGQRFYEAVMMCICLVMLLEEVWYDVIMLNLDWYKHGKYEK